MAIDIQRLQSRLGVKGEGVAGPQTMAALYAYAAGKANAATVARGPIAAIWFPVYNLNTPARICEFIAQCCNETGGFTVFEENLAYSAARLRQLWPTHFTAAQAAAAVGNPVEIASRAYDGRMGNAPWPSRDGYTYRGRGDLQLTGRTNYQAFGQALDLDLIGNPDLAAGPDGVRIALEYWRQANVNAAVDAGDYARARRLTNGGAIGLAAVAAIRNRLLGLFR